MMTRREKGLNLVWLVLVALPSAGLSYFCILHSQSILQTSLGVASAVLLFGALLVFVPKSGVLAPKQLLRNSFVFFFSSYLPSAVGEWPSPRTISTIAWPVILFVFLACSGRLHDWARES